ncbi:thermonuclease family protein [Saccharibacillus sp. CPCC 101409]|uniref:thermonuclease family protein n=1 Tax=Saccharibacillus sp. CPCC 101409 TaxID=3058041 RepID=UPI0026717265|nr:thermonuclease family protein [Saccharibacillus sp. CPCC 101409]MDO3411559.1 thermonuclease family protein [Saccharibacillus sp. CPCC 101409]
MTKTNGPQSSREHSSGPGGSGGKGGGPKRSWISILATAAVLALLLFTGTGRSLLGNLLDNGGASQTGEGSRSAQTQTGGSEEKDRADAVQESSGTDKAAGEAEETGASGEPSGETRVSAEVERTVDGDTFIADLDGGGRERIRMLLIDTPETKKEGTPVQPFGPEASEYTKKLLTGREVQLEFDEEERDQYGRMLAYVYLDGESVNETLLEQGLARVVVYRPNDRYEDEFRKIENAAKSKKLGVWSISGYADKRGFHPEAVK